MRTALTVILSLTLLAGIGLIGLLVWSNTPAAEVSAPPSVEFRSVEVGATVTVAVTVKGTQVERAELWSEDRLLMREQNPNPGLSDEWSVAWQWTPPQPGVYPLAARAYDQAGRYGASALFEVVVPPRQKLLFASNRNGRFGLYSIEPDTRTSVMFSAADTEDRQPRVSSSGSVAFAARRGGAWHILSRPLVGGATTDLTPDLLSAQRPVWAPDGQHLGFEATISGTTNIFLSDARGQNRVQLTSGDNYDGQATFDPQGSRLAFAGQRGGRWDIYTVNLDGSNLTRLTSGEGQDWQPAWSPDGTRLAFASNRSGISEIYVMQTGENAEPVRLTNFPAGAEQPAWSPDGNWLAFVANTGEAQGDDRREIYLMFVPRDQPPLEGRGLIRLTQNTWDDTEPTWVGQAELK